MNRILAALVVIAALLEPAAANAQSPPPEPAATASPTPTFAVLGQALVIANGYLVFTSGESVRIAAAAVPAKPVHLGTLVRATVERATRTIVALLVAPPRRNQDDVSVDQIAGEFDPGLHRGARGAVRATSGASGQPQTITISVTVPAGTPLGDDVYLSTDRTNFAPAEVRMLRLDARTFTVSLQLAAKAQLRYEFTRGNFASIERDKLGGLITPRTLTAAGAIQTHDTVAHWADIN